jgi:hypothetical protein
MHSTLRADAHVAAGRPWPSGPKRNAHMTPLKAATPPVLAGPALAGPVLAGPALAGLAVARGEGQWLTAAHWATAVLGNGACRYDEARPQPNKAVNIRTS